RAGSTRGAPSMSTRRAGSATPIRSWRSRTRSGPSPPTRSCSPPTRKAAPTGSRATSSGAPGRASGGRSTTSSSTRPGGTSSSPPDDRRGGDSVSSQTLAVAASRPAACLAASWHRLALAAVLALAAFLDVFRLSRNGWANEYYSGAVRSMLRSWHNFFYVAFDPGGLVSVDKPPLALWLQAASAKLLGLLRLQPSAAGGAVRGRLRGAPLRARRALLRAGRRARR